MARLACPRVVEALAEAQGEQQALGRENRMKLTGKREIFRGIAKLFGNSQNLTGILKTQQESPFPFGNSQKPTGKEEIPRENAKPFGKRHFPTGKPESLQEIRKVDRS